MEIWRQIFNIIVPSCITGVFTFLITRYTFLNNIPLDKLELTYNRIYYPIYCMFRDNEDTLQLIEKSKIYLEKYKKYVDRSTEMVFKMLKDNPYDKWAYNNYKNNIYSISRGLRRKLGYLEPGRLGLYAYLESKDKCIVRLAFELPIIYLLFLSLLFIKNSIIQIVISLVFLFGLCLIGIEISIILICFIKNKVRKNKSHLGM